ncbi:sigma 54-interacting transcriptional regulator [Paenibacillus sp. MWE-103]|uniref:Sigma 54-interacting transcriptional regulator n=1 Tax=Paenibacillus artemisiicola TaxID=1172618 RepID=A0ABS3W2P3_9BACL|nr:sigma 54-interacting transcriptional regulator [Paenibacillus artemisiicola]MBO7742573.1 sigma 54-interacting transcriptional regulator [Paenibacillus artemisiicola]
MFNVEQLSLQESLTAAGPVATLGELLPLLKRGEAVVVPDGTDGGTRAALLLPRDAAFLETAFSGRPAEPAASLLADSPYLSRIVRLEPGQSAADAVAALEAEPTGGGRPLLVRRPDGSWAGYIEPDALLAFALAERRRWQAYFATLSDTVTDAVTVVDRNGEVICWNPAAEDIYDLPRADIVGRRIGEHFETETLMVLKILDEGRLIRNAYHRPREGTHVLISASPVRGPEGEIIGGIAAEQDITQLVKLNEQLTSAHTFSHQHKAADPGLFSFAKGRGLALGRVMQWAKKVAAADTPVLLLGESGTGKEQLAQIIHGYSPRAKEAFLTASCGIVPAGLLETELFGFRGGAFTGSEGGQPGLLEQAKEGTLFINEIDRMPPELQAKLYGYLSRETFRRLGDSRPIAARARIVAASTADLDALVREGGFRADLYYALNVVSVALPPLRERREDIPAMLQMYLKQFSLQYQKPLPALSPEVMLAFANYDWPGNILELRNVVERCVILCDGDLIAMEQLPPALQARQPSLEAEPAAVADPGPPPVVGAAADAADGIADAELKPLKASAGPSEELRLIRDALARTAGNKSAAAKRLGISRGTLYNKLKELGLE